MRTLARLGVIALSGPLLAVAGCADGTGPSGGGAWAEVAAGDLFTCALTSEGQAWCWGVSVFGQLGSGTLATQTRPVPVAGDLTFTTIAAGSDHVCALTPAGAAWCWGLNDFRELGAVTGPCNPAIRFASCAAEPVAVVGGTGFDAIVVAGYTSCGLKPGGAAWCWGWNSRGQVGSGDVGDIVLAPTLVLGGRTFSSLSLDVFHACGISAGGAVFCWGSNINGELGADTVATPRCGTGNGFYCANNPIAAAASVAATSVSAGGSHTCAVTSAAEAWCWGSNQNGALGNPNALGGRNEVRVAGGFAFAAVSAGTDHTCALDDAGVALCWGLNTHGQLGQASVPEACQAFGSPQPCRTSPVAVPGLPEMRRISAGAGHSCGVGVNGELWCWGRGTEGQLGNGFLVSSAAPVRVDRP